MSTKLIVIGRVLYRVLKWAAKKLIGRSSVFLLVLCLPLVCDAGPLQRLFSRTFDTCRVRVDCSRVIVNTPAVRVCVDRVCPTGCLPAPEPTLADPIHEVSTGRDAEVPAERCILFRHRRGCPHDRQVNVNVNTNPNLDLDNEAVAPEYIEPEEEESGSIFGHLVGIGLLLVVCLAAIVYSLLASYNAEHNS